MHQAESIAGQPVTAQSLHDRARALQTRGALADAIALYLKALEVDPQHAESLHLLGVSLLQSGHAVQAIELIQHAIQLRSDVDLYHHNLGQALLSSNRLEEALTAFSHAIEINPALAASHCSIAALHGYQGRLLDALAAYERSINADQTLLAAYPGSAGILLQLHQWDRAIERYRQALALAPADAALHSNLGWALHESGQHEQALRCYAQAIELDPCLADTFNNQGFTLQALGRTEQAIDSYRRALALAPDFAEAANNLGNALKVSGDFKQARQAYDQAIAHCPAYVQAHFNRADLSTFTQDDERLPALQSLLMESASLHPRDQVFIHFSLAKALDDLGQCDQAFQHVEQGNHLQRKLVDYDEASTAAMFDAIPRVFNEDWVRRLHCYSSVEYEAALGMQRLSDVEAGVSHTRGFDRSDAGGSQSSHITSSGPIFIVGMPRSGSTLAEQILCCHPDVMSVGEESRFEPAVDHVLSRSDHPYPHSAFEVTPGQLQEMAKYYIDHLPPVASHRTVDKLPGNFMHVALILAAFPQARIIHATRGAVDSCLSCYFKLFDHGQGFTYDQAELGRYHRRHDRLMNHWHRVLPAGAIHTLRYEALVDDLEGQARRLLAFCNLHWDARCLKFNQHRRSVTTASAVQVRQPLFRHSLQRSKRYLPYLGPLIAALEQ